jgi:diketogulonate reductase-like aldo/keto reductase
MAAQVCHLPPLIYGTAWKKEKTRALVCQAVLAGFRAVDTAAQPKHYREDLVAQGIVDAMHGAGITRSELYVQTKYTSVMGQDPSSMPYDAQKSITDQVQVSVNSSLRNFEATTALCEDAYIDCLVLHSPFPRFEQTKEAWRAMESHVPHHVRTLGISNIYQPSALRQLYDFAIVKPSVVQNRFYGDSGYDEDIRAFCKDRDLVYQSFWTLTANPHLLKSKPVADISQRIGVSKAVALYSLVLGLGNMAILDGTTNVERMAEDLEGVEKIRTWSRSQSSEWQAFMDSFRELLRR